jgi:hypothetical protein
MKTADNPFGDLSDFQPTKPTVKPAASNSTVAAVAHDHGFTVNNFPETPIPAKRRKAHGPALMNKTYRLYVSDANKLQKWMNDNELTQREGFAILARSLPVVPVRE